MKKAVRHIYIHSKPKMVMLAAALIFISGIAKAQKDTTKKLKEVNINANRLPNVQSVTPSQQINSTDFKHYAALTVADIANNFAGVNVRDYGGIGGLKTVSVRSLGANHTGVLYDGVLLDDAQNGQIDLGKFNLYNIQSISLYNAQLPGIVQPARAFASASILDIKTVRPVLTADKPYKILVGSNVGSFSLINPYLQWQQRISNRLSFIINNNYTKADGHYKYKVHGDGSDTLSTRTNTDVKALQTDASLYWTKSDSNRFKAQINYYNSDRGLPGPVIYYTQTSNQRLKNRDFLAQSSYEYFAKSSFHLLLNAKYSQNYLNYLDPDFLNNSGGANEHYTQHQFYQSASVGYHIKPNWEVAYAIDGIITNFDADVFKYAFPTRYTLLNSIATDLSFGKWHFQGNLLYNYLTDHVKTDKAGNDVSALSPTIAATFQPSNPSFQLRAFYKSIFRNPTFAEQYYYAVAPRDLKPEYTKQYDLGAAWKKSFDGVLSDIALTADAYYNYVRNKIIYLPTRSPETPSATNLGSVDIKGLDLTLKSRFVPAIGWLALLNVNYTYQDAIDVTNPNDSFYLDQIPYTPKNLLSFNTGINHGQIGVYYTATFSSSRYFTSNNTPENYLAGYKVSNASLIYNFMLGHKLLNASFEVNNLFNEDYVVIRSYPMPGRSYRLSFQITI
ncbi:TonB-dependent receptor plug domain-containing protein [Mucilaginibacter sp. KACC 22063]|uniref:TonB-dependent receptor plug domain-containing protein n=1 Tax=Mucilaginibacter sp. KACC 22063 TaxID=3025666 RepID=UPI0023657ABE|nr:TonB-dependent receptor [Mucilaginibacter sp. KACC 22063]WDF53523.1 TonB-dependent receptor [Mucilaginibacter sp. KACC 22063]